MASASGLFSSQDFVIASVVNFGKDDIATILASFCFNKKKRKGKISLILDDKMKDIALSKILDELKWSRVEKYKKLAATSESKRLNSMKY